VSACPPQAAARRPCTAATRAHATPRPRPARAPPAEAECGASYYCFRPAAGYRFLVLDGYDVSLLGWPPGHPHHEQARALLEAKNPNEEKNSSAGLSGTDMRFVKYGGGVGERQLAWLAAQLKEAGEAGEKVRRRRRLALLLLLGPPLLGLLPLPLLPPLARHPRTAPSRPAPQVLVGCHLPLCPGTCPPACLLWNYDRVLALLRSAGCVAATICGHTHQNGYTLDGAGIHHVVLPAVVETLPGRDAFGVVEVYDGCLVLRGRDAMLSLKMQVAARQKGWALPSLPRWLRGSPRAGELR
jgi:manganese-dependent ADP-ribose/CDP-alcohol diphosphatase